MKIFKIRTRHFVLTKMADGDQEKYYKLSCNENVMKFVTGYALTRKESDEMFEDFLYENNSDTYFGRYFIEDSLNGDLIGAVKLDKVGTEIEIGYRIQEEHWGKGIATEIATDLISFAQDKLKAKNVIAFVNIKNAASIRVLEKAGMENIKTIEDIDEVKYKFSYEPQKEKVVKNVISTVFEFIEDGLKNFKVILGG